MTQMKKQTRNAYFLKKNITQINKRSPLEESHSLVLEEWEKYQRKIIREEYLR